jgi:SAM-dependent methyltransferase
MQRLIPFCALVQEIGLCGVRAMTLERVLDVGGWFVPFPNATHVVDLMPYETRGAKLQPGPLEGERFSKETWFQCDFLAPGFRLPYPDKYFDFVYCGHTVEDLTDPAPLLAEMARVGTRGKISCPSRIHEQTRGVLDRKTNLIGHQHHKWIVEVEDGGLKLYSKSDSQLNHAVIPHRVYEREIASNRYDAEVEFEWRDAIPFCFVRGAVCALRASQLASSIKMSSHDRLTDAAVRFARRVKYMREGNPNWWPEIVEISRPYSTIPIG